MTTALQYVTKIASTTKRKEKEEYLKEALNDPEGVVLFKYFLAALNPYKMYNVKNYNTFDQETIDNFGNDWEGWNQQVWEEEFFDLLDKLHSGEISGSAARESIESFRIACRPKEWNILYAPILGKDYRCGIGIRSINKILKETPVPHAAQYIIPKFECQLAHTSDKLPPHFLADYKLDGARFLVMVDKDEQKVLCYSRGGELKEQYIHIIKEFLAVSKTLQYSYVFDGELISTKFTDVMKTFNRKYDMNNIDMEDPNWKKALNETKMMVFDIIPLKDFQNGYCSIPLIDRDRILQEVFDQTQLRTCPFIEKVDKIEFVLPKDETSFQEFKRIAVERGYEGIMIKDINGHYECDRSTSWIKYKPFITLDLKITSLKEGTGKYVGKLGAIECQGFDDDNQVDINVEVGSGLSDKLRNEMWKNQEQYIGMIAEIKADSVSVNEKGEHSLRFPRFSKFRILDKQGNKL